jgi:hypothetical protein
LNLEPEKCVKTHLKARWRLKNQGSARQPTYKIVRPDTAPTSGRARSEGPDRCQSEPNRPATAKQLAFTYRITPASASEEAVPPLRGRGESQCFRAFAHLWSIKSGVSGLVPITVQNGRLLARAQNAEFCSVNKPLQVILGAACAFFRLNEKRKAQNSLK